MTSPSTSRLRPPDGEAPPPPPPPQPRNPSWLSGVISGAGRLISSVFVSDDSSEDPSSSDDEDSAVSDSSEDEGIDTIAQGTHKLNQGRGEEYELCRDNVGASSSIVPSESKHAIEQLLMRASFSRDECKQLTEILQSRVANYPSAKVGGAGSQTETQNISSDNAISSIEGYPYLRPHVKQDTNTHSPDVFNSLLHGCFAPQAHRRDVHETAVTEAKKWLEEQKLASSFNSNLDCGPSISNTSMLHYDAKSELGSPVDIAKSYMRLLPLCHSPSIYNTMFRTPPPSGILLNKDYTCAATNNSLPSSKVLKRKYVVTEPSNTDHVSRGIRMRLKDNIVETPNNEQYDPSISLTVDKALISSAAERKELCVQDHHTNGALSLPDEKAVEVNCSEDTCNVSSVNIVSKFGGVLSAGQLTTEYATPKVPGLSYSKLGSETRFSHSEAHKTMDVEDPLQAKDTGSSFPLLNESLVLPATLVEHDGDPLSEAKKLLPKEVKSTAPSPTDVTNPEDVRFPTVHTSTSIRESLQVDKPSHSTNVEESGPFADSRQHKSDAQLQEVHNLNDKFSAKNASEDCNTNSDLETLSKGDPNPTSSNNEPKVYIPGGPINEEVYNIDVHNTNSYTRMFPNGARMKSMERLLADTKPLVQPVRGKGRGRRGRGRK